MTRAALLLFVALLGGCRTPQGDTPIDSPGASASDSAGAELERGAGSRSLDAKLANGRAPASSLIAVATTSPSEAQPCERVCGSLGDCLLADADYTTSAAGGLELECLDLCVHSADAEPAKADFLACGAQNECGQLQACAEKNWTALAAARQGPTVEGVLAPAADSCELGCRWLFSCLYTNAPPGAALDDPSAQQALQECTNQCAHYSESDREYFAAMPACLINRCTFEGVYQCIEESQSRY